MEPGRRLDPQRLNRPQADPRTCGLSCNGSVPFGGRCDDVLVVDRVVVAGASRGLGRAIAERYARIGCEVWAGCRRPNNVVDLGALGVQVRVLDVADEASVQYFADEVPSDGVNVLVNATGVDARSFGAATDARGPFDLSPDLFLAETRVNAVGPMLMTRAFRDHLVAAPGSKVINLSSRTGSMQVGADLCWDIGYNASKAALNAVTVRMARLLTDEGVTVVAVHPGWVSTDMGGPAAATAPEEAAQMLVELIRTLGPEHAGAFLQADGSTHPW